MFAPVGGGAGPGPGAPAGDSDSEEDVPVAPIGFGLSKWSNLMGPPPDGGVDPQMALQGRGAQPRGYHYRSTCRYLNANISELFNLRGHYRPDKKARVAEVRAADWSKDKAYAACAVHYQYLCAKHQQDVPAQDALVFKKIGRLALNYHVEAVGMMWPPGRERLRNVVRYLPADMPTSASSRKAAARRHRLDEDGEPIPQHRTAGMQPSHPDYGQVQREVAEWKNEVARLVGLAVARCPQMAAFMVNFSDTHYLPGLKGHGLAPYRGTMALMVCLNEAMVYVPHRGTISFASRANCEEELPWLLAYLGMASYARQMSVRAFVLRGAAALPAPAAPPAAGAGGSPVRAPSPARAASPLPGPAPASPPHAGMAAGPGPGPGSGPGPGPGGYPGLDAKGRPASPRSFAPAAQAPMSTFEELFGGLPPMGSWSPRGTSSFAGPGEHSSPQRKRRREDDDADEE